MWRTTQFVIVLVAILFTSNFAFDCDYFDTVDLSEIEPFKNGSYLYENLLIPPEFTAEYDYALSGSGDERIPVAKHIRGCACKLRPCVRFCCHHNQLYRNDKCIGETDEALEYNPYLNITLSDGTVVERHVLNEFVVQRDLPKPCADTESYPFDDRQEGYEWALFENGTFKREADGAQLSKSEYCLQPYELSSEIRIVPHNCALPSEPILGKTIVISLSLVSFGITMFVYKFVPKLWNLHGKCFVCYLLSLFLGYSMLLLALWGLTTDNIIWCTATSCLGYFGIMSAFFWLTVVSLDLWNSFRGTNYNVNRFKSENRFFIYSLYAWGMPLTLTITVLAIDQSMMDSDNDNLIPGLTFYGCWIKTQDWSAMVYLYGPMLVLIIFNTTLFIMTAARIIVIKKDIHTVVERQNKKRKIRSEETLFLRLFIIMGISWSLEIVSYLIQNENIWSEIFAIADYFHFAEGIIILMLFVLKRRVIKLFIDRCSGKHQPLTNALRTRSSTNSHRIVLKLRIEYQ